MRSIMLNAFRDLYYAQNYVGINKFAPNHHMSLELITACTLQSDDFKHPLAS